MLKNAYGKKLGFVFLYVSLVTDFAVGVDAHVHEYFSILSWSVEGLELWGGVYNGPNRYHSRMIQTHFSLILN